MDTILWLQANLDHIIFLLTSIVTAASAIAAITSTPSDNRIIGKAYKVLDIFALNIGRAKDKSADTAAHASAKKAKMKE